MQYATMAFSVMISKLNQGWNMLYYQASIMFHAFMWKQLCPNPPGKFWYRRWEMELKSKKNDFPLSTDQKDQIEERPKLFSSKSICKGGLNEIYIHEMVSLFHSCAHTGHSKFINIGYNLDSLNPFKGLTGAHLLHGNN